MKLEAKLGVSTGVLILALFVSAQIASMRIHEANRLSDFLINQRVPVISLARDIRFAHMTASRDLVASLLLGDNPADRERFRLDRQQHLAAGDAETASLLAHIQQLNQAPEAAEARRLQAQLEDVRAVEDQVARLSEPATPDAFARARSLVARDLVPADAQFLASLTDFVDSQNAKRDLELEHLDHANRDVVITLWTATIAGSLIGGFISFLLSRRITRDIGLVSARARAIASGDLTGAPLGISSSDQIGALARAIEQMQTGLAAVIRTVSSTTGTLASSVTSISSTSEHIHRRIDQQTQQTHQAATAMQEMSASIAEVSRHASSAAETSRSAAETAHEGGDIVKQMLESMHRIDDEFKIASSNIGLLGEDSRRISQIVTVIGEIAGKTNLLALNAAIEAARAGEHGRGFAVVAGEVRRLAENTAQATGQISTMIQGIQDRTQAVVKSTVSGTRAVEQGVATTTRAGDALERIIGIAERVDRMIAQIAIAASQQAASADQSSASLDSIHSLSYDNLSEMAVTTSGIEDLRATAETLESQVEHFRLDLSKPDPAKAAPSHPHLAHPALAHTG